MAVNRGYATRKMPLFSSGVAETALTAVAFLEFLDDAELRLHDRNEHHLGDAIAGFNGERFAAAIPYGNEYLSLIIRVDESHEVPEHDAVFVSESRTWQQHRGETGFADMNGDGKDTEAMMTAHSLLLHHRKMIRDGISFAKENVQDLGKFYFLDGRGKIDEGIIGIICGMWLHPMAKKPVLGVSDGEPAADGKPTIKISSRANRLLLAEGVNLGIAIKETCEGIAHGAIGGGHRIAAGASVPKEKINEFLTRMGESLDKQRKNE